MPMPIIKPSNIKREQSITDIIESVALEQTALSNILNAEGEKIKTALELCKSNDDLLKINKSVKSMISSITILETILHAKLELFDECLCKDFHTKPCFPSKLTYTLNEELELDNETEQDAL